MLHQVVGEPLHRVVLVLTRREPQADLGAGPGQQDVAGVLGGGGVHAQHGEGWLVPQPLGDAAAADERDAVQQAGVGAEDLDIGVGDRGRGSVQPGDRDLARVVVQRGQQPAQRGEGVGDGAAEHSGVDGTFEDPHLDGQVDQPAQAGGERGHVDRGVGGVGDDDDVAAQQLAVLGEQRRQRR